MKNVFKLATLWIGHWLTQICLLFIEWQVGVMKDEIKDLGLKILVQHHRRLGATSLVARKMRVEQRHQRYLPVMQALLVRENAYVQTRRESGEDL